MEIRETTFQEALQEHLAALQARDVQRFAATLGDDVVTVDGAGKITRGTEVVLASHRAWFESPDAWSLDFEILSTRVFGDAALALIDVAYRSGPGAAASRFLLSLLFARDGGGEWRFVFDQNTPRR